MSIFEHIWHVCYNITLMSSLEHDMPKDTENQAQHPGSDTSTNEGGKKPVFTVPLAQRIGLFAGPKLALAFGLTSDENVHEGATLSFISLIEQLIGSKIPFFVKGLALP